MRETLNGVADDAALTRKPLDEAIDDLAASLRLAPTTPVGIAGQLKELASKARTVADLVLSLAKQRGDGGVETLDWADTIVASVRGYQRDLDELMPWAGLIADDAPLTSPAAMPTLAGLPGFCENTISALTGDDTATSGIPALIDGFRQSALAAASLSGRLAALGEHARTLVDAMEFGFLFDPERELLSIGYRVSDGRLDPSYYDLLASEARLASFVAIAKGDLPTRHWFRLGRPLAPVGYHASLISWSGSMFEYLMPSLIMRAPAGSLLEQTSHVVVDQQMKYGAARDVPWGTSESAYNARDLEFTYQYGSFGIPDLGFKRGLGDNTVIAPYATALAAMVDPAAALHNLARLAAVGARGRYGWYDALDYTKSRLPEGRDVAIIRAYMAHHQGMTVIAIADALHDGSMRRRFHDEPMIQATELLLQERMPRDVAISEPQTEAADAIATVGELMSATQRRFDTAHAASPRTHLLSNGSYAVMITAAGSGYSRWRDMAITRWKEDVALDGWGSYVFLRDPRSGEVWSAGYQPSGAEPDRYEVAFSEGRAEIVRHDGTICTTLEIAVSSEDDAEVRRVSVTNLGSQEREIELTSYAEIVLAPPPTDDAHPAFAKLFVETEFVASAGALLATRRLRTAGDCQAWAAHLAVVEGEKIGDMQFETDRARFLGRACGIRTPTAMANGLPLSNTVGSVLDPVFSLRCSLRLLPGATGRVAFWTLIAPSRAEVLNLVDKHRSAMAFDRAMTLAWTQAQVQLFTSGLPPAKQTSFSASPIVSCIPIRRCVRPPRHSSMVAARHPCCGPTGSPGTSRSSWCASTRAAIWSLYGYCCSPTSTGG